MQTLLKEKIIKEIEQIPDDKIPKLYQIIHLLTDELSNNSTINKKRGSLSGIWKDSSIDESLFVEARRSLFPFEDINY